MMNVFPILFLAPLAYTILRVTVGVILLLVALRHGRGARAQRSIVLALLVVLELVLGAMLIAGYLTQVAALATLVYALTFLVLGARIEQAPVHRPFFALLAATALSLTITGAGIFAIDIPL